MQACRQAQLPSEAEAFLLFLAMLRFSRLIVYAYSIS